MKCQRNPACGSTHQTPEGLLTGALQSQVQPAARPQRTNSHRHHNKTACESLTHHADTSALTALCQSAPTALQMLSGPWTATTRTIQLLAHCNALPALAAAVQLRSECLAAAAAGATRQLAAQAVRQPAEDTLHGCCSHGGHMEQHPQQQQQQRAAPSLMQQADATLRRDGMLPSSAAAAAQQQQQPARSGMGKTFYKRKVCMLVAVVTDSDVCLLSNVVIPFGTLQ